MITNLFAIINQLSTIISYILAMKKKTSGSHKSTSINQLSSTRVPIISPSSGHQLRWQGLPRAQDLEQSESEVPVAWKRSKKLGKTQMKFVDLKI